MQELEVDNYYWVGGGCLDLCYSYPHRDQKMIQLYLLCDYFNHNTL